MENKKQTIKDYLIKYYYKFIGKLYGEEKPCKNEEFEKIVESKFDKNPNKDIDIEITLEVKTASGKCGKRKARSVVQFAEFFTKPLPEDTTRITFYGEFVERNESQEKLRSEKKKDRFAFKEQILVVDVLDDKHVRKATKQSIGKMNPNIKAFEKEDLESFSKVIKFEKKELTL